MRKPGYVLVVLMLSSSPLLGAVVTFDPSHVPNVVPGTNLQFDITVSVESLSGFNWADVVIGIDQDNADLSFVYGSAWDTAFSNVTTITYDSGFYKQDVLVGGNNPTSIGTSLLLGTVTVNTTGLADGTYEVVVDSDLDGTSGLGLDTEWEDLAGAGTFTIPEPAALLFFLTGIIGLCRRARRRQSRPPASSGL